MALKIRLTRLGDKGCPFYRLVVADSRASRDGAFIENLGTFDPKIADPKIGIKIDRAMATEWLAKGALPTETARVILEKAGILEKPKAKKTSKPKPATPKPDKMKK